MVLEAQELQRVVQFKVTDTVSHLPTVSVPVAHLQIALVGGVLLLREQVQRHRNHSRPNRKASKKIKC